MKHFFILLFIPFSCYFANAQPAYDSLKKNPTNGAQIIQDRRVNELVQKHVLVNEAKKGKIKGYRVQIHFGPEKAKALDIKSKFASQNYSIASYLDYEQPYFKIRVGDFRTKLEAYKLLQEISNDFPGAFIVSDDVEMPELK